MAQLAASLRQSALRRGLLIGPDAVPAELPTSQQQAFAALVEFANLGFIASADELRTLPLDAIVSSLAEARKIVGADRDMTPIYPGFPEQVEALPTLTLLVEQILHYWSAGTLLPDYPAVVREGLPVADMLRNARSLKVAPLTEVAASTIAELVGSSVAISEDDRTFLWDAVDLRFSGENFRRDSDAALKELQDLARSARNAENLQVLVRGLAVIAETGDSLTQAQLVEAVVPQVRTLDSLLRTVLAIYGEPAAPQWAKNYEKAVGNLSNSNARAVRFRNIPRSARRLILQRLGELSSGFYADGLVGRRNLWRGVIRAAHAFDLKLSEASLRAANIIASNIEHRTVNSLVEEALENRNTGEAAALLKEHKPGELIRRLVAILRLTEKQSDADSLAEAVVEVGSKTALTTLISAYNGVLSANDEHARVTRVAGLNNTMQDRSEVAKIDAHFQAAILGALDEAMVEALKRKDAPRGPVAVSSELAVPLLRRDAATADRTLDRGQELQLVGEGDTLRIFSHWQNNQSAGGYMDIGAIVLDGEFSTLAVSTWDSWSGERDWSTYSGDKFVYPGDSAAEYFDIKLAALKSRFPTAKWVAMSIQSWSGFPMANVDLIAGAMLRSEAQSGEVFDARSISTAFKPTTTSLQAVPLAVNLETGAMVWVDSSSGSMAQGQSSTGDESIGAIVYDEIARPRLTLGDLAQLWARAHGAETVDQPVDRDQLLGLL